MSARRNIVDGWEHVSRVACRKRPPAHAWTSGVGRGRCLVCGVVRVRFAYELAADGEVFFYALYRAGADWTATRPECWGR